MGRRDVVEGDMDWANWQVVVEKNERGLCDGNLDDRAMVSVLAAKGH